MGPYLGQISESVELLQIGLGVLDGGGAAEQDAVQTLDGLVSVLELLQVGVDYSFMGR